MAFLYNVCTYDSGRYQASRWDVCCPVADPVEAPEYTWISVIPVIDWAEQIYPPAIWAPEPVVAVPWNDAVRPIVDWEADQLGTAEWARFISTDSGWTVTPFAESGWQDAVATVEGWLAALVADATEWADQVRPPGPWRDAPFVDRPGNCA